MDTSVAKGVKSWQQTSSHLILKWKHLWNGNLEVIIGWYILKQFKFSYPGYSLKLCLYIFPPQPPQLSNLLAKHVVAVCLLPLLAIHPANCLLGTFIPASCSHHPSMEICKSSYPLSHNHLLVVVRLALHSPRTKGNSPLGERKLSTEASWGNLAISLGNKGQTYFTKGTIGANF